MIFKVVFKCFSGAPDLSDLSYALLKKIKCTLKKSGHLCRSATTLRRRMRTSILFWPLHLGKRRKSGSAVGRSAPRLGGRARGRVLYRTQEAQIPCATRPRANPILLTTVTQTRHDEEK